MKKGIAFGVGVGPGDPELMTLKACRLIRENEVIAFPGKTPEDSAAYKIAAAAVPGLGDKILLPLFMPMVRDRSVLEQSRRDAADAVIQYLDRGMNVVLLTLGDPAVYSTFTYIRQQLEADGYEVQTVSGVASFCAAAARLGLSLAEGDEPLHIVPALFDTQERPLGWPGNYAIMKSAGRMHRVRQKLAGTERETAAVENCGMQNEKIYRSLDEIPDDAGYFTMIIAKEKK